MSNRLNENEIFYCEPLMANEENLRLIQKFHVAAETGLGLELYLKKHAVSDEDIAFSYNIKRIERLLFGEVALNEAGEAQ